MGFWLALAVSFVMVVVGELLRPKQSPPNAKASGLDDFDLPTAEEGRSIPVFFGKVKVNGPNVVAYGDLESVALTKKVKTGLFSSKRQTYAHEYYLGMQMVVGHGSDGVEIHEVHFGDSMPRATRVDEGNGVTRFTFDDRDFFGGKEKEGGISGVLRFYAGTDTQPANDYLANITTGTPQAYRGLCHAVLEKMYLGTSHYIKTISFIVSRYPNTLEVPDGKHRIGDDANPICVIFEQMTDPVWGVGMSGADFDLSDLRRLAEQVHDEGYGVSLLYNGSGPAKDAAADILRHIDGVMFTDPQTGLIRIRLARKDYDPATIPVYGVDDFREGISFSRPSWMDTKNTVKSTYVDRSARYTTAVVSQQDLANVMQRGGEVAVEEIDFSGFSEYAPAALATARALKTMSYPLARMTGTLTRAAWKTKPGDVFVLNWPDLGVEAVVFRITKVTYGGVQKNWIGIEAVEDIFSVSDVAYTQPPPSGWVDPLRPPEEMLLQMAVEMPFALEPLEGSTVGTFGYRSNSVDEGYAIVSSTGPGALTERGRVVSFTPFALLAGPYPATDLALDTTGFAIEALRGMPDSEGQEFALIKSLAGEEWVAYQGVSGGYVRNVVRGIFDTPPIDHPDGAVVIFASSGYGVENEGAAYTASEAVRVKLLPYNARGVLAQEDALELTVNTSRRGSRPLPPGRVRVNGTHPHLVAAATGDFVVTWAGRNRMHATLLTQDDLNVAPEDGTTYIVRARRADTNELLASGEGNLPAASIALAYTGLVTIEVTASRSGLESYAPQRFALDYAAGGTTASRVTVDTAEYILDGGGA